MSEHKHTATNRLLAWLLTVVMLLSMVPTTAFAAGGSIQAPGDNEKVTINVVAPDGSALEGATVSYKIDNQQKPSEPKTNVNGTVTIDLSKYFKNNGDSVTLKYTVSKDGYVTTAEAEVEIAKEAQGSQIALGSQIDVPMDYAGYNVTVTKTDGGTVKDGKTEAGKQIFVKVGDSLTLTAEANEGYQIDSIKVGENNEKITDKQEMKFSIEPDGKMTKVENVTVSVTFVRVYTITVKYDNKTGSVTANGASSEDFKGDTGTVTVAANEAGKIEIVATPEKNYRVSEVKIDGTSVNNLESVAKLEVVNNGGYTTELEAKDYAIEVTFAPNEYTVTASYNKEQGEVKFGEADSATVQHGGTATVTITPTKGYEIASVEVGKKDRTSDLTDNEDGTYTLTLKIEADTTVTVTFAKKTYTVTVTVTGNGNAWLQNENNTVQHGGEATVIMQPETGYVLSKVTYQYDGSEEIELEYSQKEDGSYSATVKNVTAKVTVNVIFTKASDVTSAAVKFTPEPLRTNDKGNVLVFGGTKVEISPNTNTNANYTKVRLTKPETITYTGLFGSSWTITEDVNVDNDNVSGSNSSAMTLKGDWLMAENEYTLWVCEKVKQGWGGDKDEWKTVDIDKILFDDIDPTVSVNDKDPTETTLYFPGDADLSVTASDDPSGRGDTDKWTGISKIEYQISADPENWPETWTTLYTLGDTETAQKTVTPEETIKVSCPTEDVTDEEGNVTGSNMVYGTKYVRVKATDMAGNAGKDELYTYTLVFNPEDPTLELTSITATKADGTEYVFPEEENKPAFTNKDVYASVTAVIRVTDKTFNPNGLTIGWDLPEDEDGKTIEIDTSNYAPAKDEDGNDIKDTYDVTVEFTVDGEYHWRAVYDSLTLTRGAWTGYKTFTIDTEDPTGEVNVKDTTHTSLLDILTFGVCEQGSVVVSITAQDTGSSISKIQYYTDNGATTALAWENLEDKTFKDLPEGFTENDDGSCAGSVPVSEENRYAVYFRIEDAAGNYTYLCSNGIIIDKTPLSVVLTPDKAANDNGEYIYGSNDDDPVIRVNVDEPELDADGNALDTYSGIESVFYQIYVDGKPEPRVYMFPFENADPTYDELKSTWEGAITLNKADYNSSNVVVEVTAKDRAGNETTESVALDIDVTAPTIEVEYWTLEDDAKICPEPYDKARQAIVTITERSNHFDAKAATDSITIVATDANEKDLGTVWTISDWNTTEGETPDKATHTATITFDTDANYKLSVAYTDKAGNAAEWTYTNEDGEAEKIDFFKVDDTAPRGEVQVDDGNWLTELLNTLTFGIYRQKEAKVTIKAWDETDPSVKVYYYIENGKDVLTEAALTGLWEADTGNNYPQKKYNFKQVAENDLESVEEDNITKQSYCMTVSEENRHTVYFRIEDAVGNYTYLYSNGIIIDSTKLDVVLTPDKANDNGAYGANPNNDPDTVNIQVDVKEPVEYDDKGNALNTYSGIESVFYQIYVDGKPEPRVYMFPFENAKPTYDELKSTWEGTITLNKEAYNSSDVVVEVTAKDRAGNETTESVALDIDVTAPKIEVEYDNASKYSTRTATVTITERSNHFDAKAATDGITITAVDANEKDLGTIWTISDWNTTDPTEGETPDEATHTATITFNVDANYTLSVAYTDKAGNKAVEYSDNFTVDTTAPTGTVTAKIGADEAGKWEQLIGENWSFKIKTNKDVEVSVSTEDATTSVDSLQYYLYNGNKALNEEALEKISSWVGYSDSITLEPDQQVTVYFKLTDTAGNVAYLSTNGMILDMEAPDDDGIAPQVTAEPEQPIKDFYDDNVTVKVNVKDPEAGGTYSGLKSVTYQVFNMDLPEKKQVTQEGTLYLTDEKAADRLQTLKDATIEVDAEKNNSNNVKVEITAVDNAGNEDTFTVYLAIDETAPTIAVKYNNNKDIGGFYNDDRTATITITERNFDKTKVKVTITNTDDVIPAISEWKTVDGTGNGDDTTHQATITYDADGDYTFAIEYTDEAGNTCPGVTYAKGTTHGDSFTIDQTKPVVSVAYNNNNAANGKYFNANRTATVTITEHNFDVKNVTWAIGHERGGVEPQISWVDKGDIHTATIRYAADGDYTFGVSVTDKAGNKNGTVNYGNSVAGRDFVIDTTYADMITIGGVENGKAYGHDASVIPTITIADRNLNNYTVTLTGVQKGTTIDLTQKVNALLNAGSERVTGFLDIFEVVQDMDGIYTLSLTAQDRAGNRDAGEVTFTVNRFGSVYVYSEYLQTLIADGGAYVKSVTDDLVITEYNADKLLSGSLKLNVTCDGKPLENVDYSVTPEFNSVVAVGDSGWYQYRYTISKSNFTADGVYKVSVSTEDATGNTPENNNYEDMGITFRVDNTQAEISSIIGLENAIINAPEAEIQYTVFDTMGIKSVKIYVDGVLVDEVTEFDSDLNNYTGSFTLGENSSAQSVRIVVEDLSGNITDTDAEGFSSAYEFNRTVTVSTNFFVRWYANKALFWGSIGAVAAAAVVWFLLAGKKKKKDEDTTK